MYDWMVKATLEIIYRLEKGKKGSRKQLSSHSFYGLNLSIVYV